MRWIYYCLIKHGHKWIYQQDLSQLNVNEYLEENILLKGLFKHLKQGWLQKVLHKNKEISYFNTLMHS